MGSKPKICPNFIQAIILRKTNCIVVAAMLYTNRKMIASGERPYQNGVHCVGCVFFAGTPKTLLVLEISDAAITLLRIFLHSAEKFAALVA